MAIPTLLIYWRVLSLDSPSQSTNMTKETAIRLDVIIMQKMMFLFFSIVLMTCTVMHIFEIVVMLEPYLLEQLKRRRK